MDVRILWFLMILLGCSKEQGELSSLNNLTSNLEIKIEKSWAQEPNGWTYPIFIEVPEGDPPATGYPVLILLHGNGGTGEGILNEIKSEIACHVLIAISGYKKSWNISNEESEAPDLEMITELTAQLKDFQNVNPNKIRILGFSNGSALANRILVENKDPAIDQIIGIVSQLSEAQYRNNKFYKPSGATGNGQPFNGYDTETTPLQNRYYLNICNQNDPVVPYNGGEFYGINFINAQDAAFAVAVSQGLDNSEPLAESVAIAPYGFEEYSYLDGQVIHIKGNEGHGPPEGIFNYIRNFLADCN